MNEKVRRALAQWDSDWRVSRSGGMLSRWPAVKDYYERLQTRPSVARALAEEHALYADERARHKAA